MQRASSSNAAGRGERDADTVSRGCMTCACGRYQYVQASVNLLWFLEGTVVHYNTTLNIQWYKSENLKTVVSYVSVHAARCIDPDASCGGGRDVGRVRPLTSARAAAG